MKSIRSEKVQLFKRNLIGCILCIMLVFTTFFSMSLLIPEVRQKIHLWIVMYTPVVDQPMVVGQPISNVEPGKW
ncbi:hypothetical protein P4679_27295 [Priestia megaterium]|uniref:hypothetical protein n=1 Tax=Priestia megaterium TaxID=1404 RepID=UPI002E209505|nr:hypothetical protein [Priestia megaterium]